MMQDSNDERVLSKRLDLKTGFVCNNNCRFCVQADKKCKGDRSMPALKQDLLNSRNRCNNVVLTGGEPTIREDFFEIVGYAQSLGYQSIQVQSNGRMFSNAGFCREAIAAGANEFSIAVHGFNAAEHDYLTSAPGSFLQAVKALKNLKGMKAYVLTNTVIVKPNYRDAAKIAGLLVGLGVAQYQLAFVHPMGAAWANFDSVVPRISLAAPFIHSGLQVGIEAGVVAMAEAMPYCHMQGYEKHVSEKYIPETEIRGIKSQNTDSFTRQRRIWGKAKFPQCRACRHNAICEGPWKEYAERMGNHEFKPL